MNLEQKAYLDIAITKDGNIIAYAMTSKGG